MTHSRSPEEAARWLITSSIDMQTVRARMYEIDDREELRTWVAEFNQVRDQLPPARKQALQAAIEQHDDRLAE